MSDQDQLTATIRRVTDLWDEPLDEVHDLPPIVNAILAEFLPAHDAKVRAEQRETDAVIAESDQFWDPRGEVLSSDEVSYNVARREAAAAIRAVPANTNTEEA